MNCPNCGSELQPADRQGIEVDYCPICRGVWVGREQLDHILASPAPFDVDWTEGAAERSANYSVDWAVSEPRPEQPRQARMRGFWTNLFTI
jgi:Zn-finger nucleic acid-binding protein